MSALVPSSVMIWPFTDMAPELISFSAVRREAIPAAAMIFCKRSADMLGKDYQEMMETLRAAACLIQRILIKSRMVDSYGISIRPYFVVPEVAPTTAADMFEGKSGKSTSDLIVRIFVSADSCHRSLVCIRT